MNQFHEYAVVIEDYCSGEKDYTPGLYGAAAMSQPPIDYAHYRAIAVTERRLAIQLFPGQASNLIRHKLGAAFSRLSSQRTTPGPTRTSEALATPVRDE